MELVLDLLSWICLGCGSLLILIGTLGLLRLPDFYTRLHAAGITDTFGAWLILMGLMFQAGLSLIAVKLLMVIGFLILTSPTSGHALAKAAWLNKLKPFVATGEEQHDPDHR